MSKLSIAAAAAAAIVLTGCAGPQRNPPINVFPDMRWQGRYDPQEKSAFFSDKRASRRPVEGTIARGPMESDDSVVTGVANNQYIGKNPRTIDAALMRTGQTKFNTYCSPCHDQTGQGRGIVAKRATWIPTNLHEGRIKLYNDGEIYYVIANGRRSMPGYRFQIPVEDRWAIVAYVRALQRSTSATTDEVPADRRASLEAEAVRMSAQLDREAVLAKEAAAKASADAAAAGMTAAPATPAPAGQGNK